MEEGVFGLWLMSMMDLTLCLSVGFSESEVAMMSTDPADLVDRLDLSMSSIDMTNTSLAMHEEKDSEISGVGM